MNTAIVMTTILDAPSLDSFVENVISFSRDKVTMFYVIPDRKTPAALSARVERLRRAGGNIVFPTLEEQDQFIKSLDIYPTFIPYDSDNRRNIGYLMALRDDNEVIISVDDDNFCMGGDFVGDHLYALRATTGHRVTNDAGWVNFINFLHTANHNVFSRGFPYAMRRNREAAIERVIDVKVAVNAGLWANDPDVDAITRIAVNPKIDLDNSLLSYDDDRYFLLARDAWSPINSQNTAVTREALAAYYFIRMGYLAEGGRKIDRFGDIFSGYFLEMCVKNGGEYVSFGLPIVDHQRTTHDLLRDLDEEYLGIVLLEEMLLFLTETRLTGATYVDRYLDLANRLREFARSTQSHSSRWRDEFKTFLNDTSDRMIVWLKAVLTITGE